MEIELPFIPDRVDLLDFETGIGYRYEKKTLNEASEKTLKILGIKLMKNIMRNIADFRDAVLGTRR